MVDASARPEKPSTPVREMGVRVWPVGSLLRAIADSLEARFNPVAVQGEIAGFSRASSGHCYFSLKDEQGQVRCAMFRRAAGLLDFSPSDGQLVELRGRLGVYEPRGELQLVVESMRQAGQGNLFEQFLALKAKLEAEGLFEVDRKRPLPLLPRAIGVVTSLGAAALHDVVSALQRRAPHIPVVIYPASVQGGQAAGELREALLKAYRREEVDVLLLVRGGGAMEDLWAFNDEQLARTIVASPVPVVSGVGHETDFTIADFCADVRAPTPTAAAELCACICRSTAFCSRDKARPSAPSQTLCGCAHSSAAAVGVGARTSAQKSAMVKSVSCPTPLTMGTGETTMVRASCSSLKAHKSSIAPPPRTNSSTSTSSRR